MRIHPDRETFDTLAKTWPLVPVWTELLADVSTPVGIFPALAAEGAGILLESVERSERWGRYSFAAGDPAAVIVAQDDGVSVRDVRRPLPIADVRDGTPTRTALRDLATALAAPRVPDLPPLTGGLMGYVAYEAATLLDGHPAPHASEAP
ncbi:MAG: anthranilate synthase component I, partial [Actinomycetota bacterium]